MNAGPRSLSASTGAGALAGAIGVVALTGWVLDVGVLKSVGLGRPTMPVSIALSLALFGLGVVLLNRSVPPRVLRRLVIALGISAGGLALFTHAAVTGLALVTTGIALLALDVGRGGALAQTLALATGVLGLLNLVGHAYALHRSLGFAEYSAVAVHTAFGLVVLSAAILLARPDRALTRMALADTPAGIVVRRLLPVVIGVPLLLGRLVESGRRGALYGQEFALALTVIGPVIVLSLVVWSAASALQREDVRRRRAETALQRADEEVDRVIDANKALVETTTRLRTLERLNRLVSSSLDFDAVLVAIARAASDITATPVVSFWIVDEAAATVTVRAWSDAKVGADFPTDHFAIGEGAVGRVAATRQPLHIADIAASPAPIRARQWCEAHGLRSFYGVPVLAQDRILAVLALSRDAPLDLGEEDQVLLASFVAQAAVAIDNARLFAAAEARRRAAENAETRYRELFDRNLAGILRTRRDGRILECNDAMVRILGYRSREEVLALRAEDTYVDPAERARVVLTLRPGDRTSVAFRLRRADGSAISVLVNLAAVETDGGEIVLEGIIVDITDRERMAEALREAEALRAVARLANGASHEINNPLAVIMGHVDLLERKYGGDPETVQRLDRARSACRRIADMIAHMGRITRLEDIETSGNLPPIMDLRRSGAPERKSPS